MMLPINKLFQSTTIINKPWGHENIWIETAYYIGKILYINKGHRISRQYHNQKTETFLVLSGELTLEIGQGKEMQTLHLKPGEVYHCPSLTIHRMIAAGDSDVEVIEVSTPQLTDIVRLEDNYGREDKNETNK